MSPDGTAITPVFGTLFEEEDLPAAGHLTITDRPGFGLELRREGLRLGRPYPTM
jgi:hypothetical protein